MRGMQATCYYQAVKDGLVEHADIGVSSVCASDYKEIYMKIGASS